MLPPLRQLVSGSEPARAGARDHYRCVFNHRVPSLPANLEQDTGSSGNEEVKEGQQGISRQAGREEDQDGPLKPRSPDQHGGGDDQREGAQGIALEGIEVGAGQRHAQDGQHQTV